MGKREASSEPRRSGRRSTYPREDLVARLSVLLDLGLGYLTLERSTPTLSPSSQGSRRCSPGEGPRPSAHPMDDPTRRNYRYTMRGEAPRRRGSPARGKPADEIIELLKELPDRTYHTMAEVESEVGKIL